MIFFCGLGCWNWQEDRRRFGSPPLHELLRREGLVQNHKRTERIYQEESLSLRTRKRVKRPSHARIVQAGPAGPDEQWRWIL